MKLSLDFSAAIAAALSAAGVNPSVAILAMHAQPVDQLPRPALGIAVQEMEMVGTSLATGKLVLAYHTDPDAEPPSIAAARLAAAAEWLLSADNRATIQTLLTPREIILRTFSRGGESHSNEDGRMRILQRVLPFWLQTALP